MTNEGQGMKITFIGGGNMASALIAGLAGKLTAGANIHVVDPNAEQLARLADSYGVSTAQQVGDGRRVGGAEDGGRRHHEGGRRHRVAR
jgi:pyrroline-5-carboxylate reductase